MENAQPKRVRDELPVEIERKFLVQRLPERLRGAPSRQIMQGYLAASNAQQHVRLRRIGEKQMLAVKQGDSLARTEVEVELDAPQFEALWPLTSGRRLRKTRYYVPYAGRTIELDAYHGAHEGLLVAEVEFASEETAGTFRPPAWLGRDVTDEERYSNYYLACFKP